MIKETRATLPVDLRLKIKSYPTREISREMQTQLNLEERELQKFKNEQGI